MSVSLSHGRAVSAEPNVTPLIDVLLVLLIIFMVIVPVAPRGLEAMLPQKHGDQRGDEQTIVVHILAGAAGPTYTINGEMVQGKAQLASELNRIYSVRAQKVLFVRGDAGLTFASVAEVIDMGRAAGVDHVGILTPAVAAN